MDFLDVFKTLDQIASVSLRGLKEQMIAGALHQEEFRKVCIYAYDPFRTYGVKPPLDRQGTGTENSYPEIWTLLDRMAERKITGKLLQDNLDDMYATLSPQAGMVLSRILRKDLRAGFTQGSVNRVRPGTITVFNSMLAHPYEERRIKQWPVAVEPKLDGVRVLARVDYDAETAQFFSRNGKPFPAIEHLGRELLNLGLPHGRSHLWMFDGEAITSDFYDTVGAVRRKSEKAEAAEFHVFDMITEAEFLAGCSELNYESRRAQLVDFAEGWGGSPIKLVECRLAYSAEEVQAFYEECRAENLEGAIVKPLNGLWVGKRSHDWMKMKAKETLDLPVVDAIEGEGKYKGMLGALVVELDGVRINVGSGFTDQQRKELWEDYLGDLRLQDEADFYSRPNPTPSVIGRLIEVEAHERTPDGSLRHPRFIRFRDDKAEAEAA